MNPMKKLIPMKTPLGWTKNKPTETGHYWHRKGRTLNIYRIIDAADGLAAVLDRDTVVEFADLRGEWAGPIPYPEKPKKK